MRVAIFGDIHANLEALSTVLEDSKEHGCESFICLGDLVGYNANPSECLEVVRTLGCPVVKGNHDEDASLDHSLESMNPVAATALRWTREQLSDEQREWLRKLRMIRQVANFSVVHATLDQPNGWSYVTNKFDAMSSFSYQFTNVCFHGHTHVPRVFQRTDSVTELDPTQVQIDPNAKYFINAGSVGQPRDGDWRSCYVIYDIDTQTVTFRRLEYDVATTQKKILDAGLPKMLAERLAEGR